MATVNIARNMNERFVKFSSFYKAVEKFSIKPRYILQVGFEYKYS